MTWVLTKLLVAGLHAFEWVLHLFEQFPVDVVGDQTPTQAVKAGQAAVQVLALLPHRVCHPDRRHLLVRGIWVPRSGLVFKSLHWGQTLQNKKTILSLSPMSIYFCLFKVKLSTIVYPVIFKMSQFLFSHPKYPEFIMNIILKPIMC